jgi:tRNA 2-thiouridine synthesizing protein A
MRIDWPGYERPAPGKGEISIMAAIKTIDACGLSCPQPALLARQALSALTAGTLHIQVDSVSARDNVVRTGENAGCQVSVHNQADGSILISLTK